QGPLAAQDLAAPRHAARGRDRHARQPELRSRLGDRTMPDFLPQYGNTEGPFGFPLPDKTARALDQVLRALPRSEEFAYRKAVVEKGPSKILPGERSDVSWISVETPDRQKEVVIAKGMNDSQFQGNLLMTLQHNYQLPPVGRSLWCNVVRAGDPRGVRAMTVHR